MRIRLLAVHDLRLKHSDRERRPCTAKGG
jgi:hypothetical protein